MQDTMPEQMQSDAFAMLRTDGRTNGRLTHPEETSHVTDRAGEIEQSAIDQLTGATPEWLAFIASLDPVELERERFGTPTGERPGSAGWRLMITEHDMQVHEWKIRRARITHASLAAAVAEAQAWDRRHQKALTGTHMRVAMVALANTERKTA
jgi:hypothetical protein